MLHRDATGRFSTKPKLPDLPAFPEDLTLTGKGRASWEWLFAPKDTVNHTQGRQHLACIKDGVVGYISGALLRHPHHQTGVDCTVLLSFFPTSDDWRGRAFSLSQLVPPTVSESIICITCGAHAYLRGGVWPNGDQWWHCGEPKWK